MKYSILSILFTAIGFFFSLPESVRAQVQRDRYYSIYFEIADGISEGQVLAQLDEESTQKMDPGYLTVLPASEYNRLQCKFGISKILSNDLETEINSRLKEEWKDFQSQAYHHTDFSTTPRAFNYGSQSGFLSLDEVYRELDSMSMEFPSIASQKRIIGYSYQSRPIYMLKISDHVQVDENEPELYYDALHHSREPMCMMQLIFFMQYLLENYSQDPDIKCLVDSREFYFIPVVNPDGYFYNQLVVPGGGGLWRLNLRNNADGSVGVDLNRNYGFYWGYDENGSSSVPGAQTYRGSGPFSEPETEAVRNFCNQHHFISALSYHSYGNLLLYPFGYDTLFCEDDSLFRELSNLLTEANQYRAGPPSAILYRTNGSSNDWLYGDTSLKSKIYSWSPEVGAERTFWPAAAAIIPNCMATLEMNLLHAKFSGSLLEVEWQKLYQKSKKDSVVFEISVTNLGLSSDSLKIIIRSDQDFVSASSINLFIDKLSNKSFIFTLPVSSSTPYNFSFPVEMLVEASNCFQYSQVLEVSLSSPVGNDNIQQNEKFIVKQKGKLLELDELVSNNLVIIYNSFGQRVFMSKGKQTIDCTYFKPGIYFITNQEFGSGKSQAFVISE
ncbi:MAG TPA: M14 family metallopeptidase [Saprospiraceae bacterium]|nr:M14 family metallopeptidase [Saprospiraceae bacterium]